MPEQLRNLEPDYDRMHELYMTETADVVERRRFRCDYIDKHSLKDFKWLLQAVAHDDVDIRYMDKKLAEIVYER